MGLDMYLRGKRFLSKWFEEDKDMRDAVKSAFPELSAFEENPVQIIEIDAGYWRKANQIHGWFVKNVQDGEDNCKSHEVSRDDLEKLKSVCEQVLKNKEEAPNLLPVRKGFFFGSYDYDEWYFKDIEHTIKIIDRALALPNNWYFEYDSSW